MSTSQRTIAHEIAFKGIGLHTGRKCQAIFKPAPVDTGVKFVRLDLPGSPVIEAHVKNVVDIIRGTTIGQGEAKVYTIEHILSALNGLQIDNLIVELDDNEPPVADGSAKSFVEALQSTGIIEQAAPKKFFTVAAPFEYNANQTVIRIEPFDSFEVRCEVSYDHPLIKDQVFTYTRFVDYSKEIAPARTFCFDYEIEGLKKKGLAKGGSLDNAIVVGPQGIYNPGTALRFHDEFVRHKMLDLLGDLMLIGSPIQARIIAKRCGHGHNIKFLKQLLEERSTIAPVAVA